MTRYMPDEWAIPILDDLNRPFFTEGRLVLQACADCGTVQHPPEDVCHACHGSEFRRAETAGTGRIFTWAVMHYPVHPNLVDRIPYNVVLVELDDHPHVRILGNAVDLDGEAPEIGMPVQVTFEHIKDPVTGDELKLPQWRRAES